ncbi:transcription factor MYB1R1-like [Ziziphus jujuba]|uniref:Transcription factor MYB1R1-like n=1 Tax=Ziziphus jujuba TaxID=326968 RepID=A0ABM3IK62_ZIZJJ|nr:transcription factor MYB1R1-like [Ziziphus jujuba]
MSRPFASTDASVTGGGDSGVGEIMLFGFRVVVDSMRKSVSLNDLSQYELPHEASNDNNSSNGNNINGNSSSAKEDSVAGYASENDVVHNSGGNRERERKRGIPWTEDEHKLFLLGLQKVGKGDWRGISRNFVKTRTPTQVASHAQKYFLRRNNHNRRRRRSSLFDITTDTVAASPMEEEQLPHQDNTSQSHPLPTEPCNPSVFPLVPTFPVNVAPAVAPMTIENPIQDLKLGQGSHLEHNNASAKVVRPVALHSNPHATTITDLNLNLKSSTMDPCPLSLKLSLPMDSRESSATHSAFQGMSNLNNGDSIITVA